ncbi:MAG: YdeI/OmpD-associated family protein [Paludibacteraceae bacterium]|nr:YdeI/OmpD-associated family protein [Paludibacteraceae bacterium]MBP8781564.1 YdeI/OmpD-associated family protein [Paludibacteraceae bacterium]
MHKTILSGIVHEIPEDIAKILLENDAILDKWNALTPIQRNEWICWVTIVKKEQTRAEHIIRMMDELKAGKRKPCCWPGCPHRRSSTQKWFTNKSM